jgi:integrase
MLAASSSGRQRRTFLLTSALAPPTVKRYHKAVAAFLTWMDENDEAATSAADLDEILSDYFHVLYEERLEAGLTPGKSIATSAYCGVVALLPYLTGHLPIASRALRGYARLQPSISYPPFTWQLAVLVAVRMALAGHFREGVGVVLAFHCLLRGGELLSLLREDVALEGDPRLNVDLALSTASLTLRQTKTGRNQAVTITSPAVLALVRHVANSTKRGQRLFPFSAGVFRRLLHSTCASLGLSSRYVPHSLRHGGATYLFASGVPLGDIELRGRWVSSKSARRYIQFGPALLTQVEVPEWASEVGAALASDLVLSFSLAQLH